jgi:hypothetical protein
MFANLRSDGTRITLTKIEAGWKCYASPLELRRRDAAMKLPIR